MSSPSFNDSDKFRGSGKTSIEVSGNLFQMIYQNAVFLNYLFVFRSDDAKRLRENQIKEK